jgi:hydrogenase-4 component E
MYPLIAYLVPLLLVSGVLLLGCRRLESKVQVYRVQSLLLSLLTLFTGLIVHSRHTFGIAGLSFIVKCVIIPWILLRVIQKVQMKREVESYVSLPTSMLIGGLLILLSYYLIPSLPPAPGGMVFDPVLKAGISLVLMGLFVMISRKKAFTQILGLYVMDNGIFCLTTATIFEMPLIIEMGIVFELLLGALVMGILVYRIKQSFDTVNVVHLKNLRG